MCNPVCGMVHIKEPLLIIGMSSSCRDRGFFHPLSGPLLYLRSHITKLNVLRTSLRKYFLSSVRTIKVYVHEKYRRQLFI